MSPSHQPLDAPSESAREAFDLAEDLHRWRGEVDGLTVDRDLTADDVVRAGLFLTFRVNQMPFLQTEDGAVGEHLVEVRLRRAGPGSNAKRGRREYANLKWPHLERF